MSDDFTDQVRTPTKERRERVKKQSPLLLFCTALLLTRIHTIKLGTTHDFCFQIVMHFLCCSCFFKVVLSVEEKSHVVEPQFTK